MTTQRNWLQFDDVPGAVRNRYARMDTGAIERLEDKSIVLIVDDKLRSQQHVDRWALESGQWRLTETRVREYATREDP